MEPWQSQDPAGAAAGPAGPPGVELQKLPQGFQGHVERLRRAESGADVCVIRFLKACADARLSQFRFQAPGGSPR